MKNLLKSGIMTIVGATLVAVLLALTAPKAVHAVVSALVTVANTSSNPVPVQQVVPAQPFFARMVLSPGGISSVGPGASGRLAVTNISISNLSMTAPTQEVYILAPVFSPGGTCGDAVIGGGDLVLRLLVPQAQTLTVSYPTPLVFTPINGVSCLAAENFVDSPIEVYVTGFVQ